MTTQPSKPVTTKLYSGKTSGISVDPLSTAPSLTHLPHDTYSRRIVFRSIDAKQIKLLEDALLLGLYKLRECVFKGVAAT